MIRKAEADQKAAVVATLTAAFENDAIIRYMFADDTTYAQRAAVFFGHYFDVRLEGGEIFVTDDVTGAALWNPPGGNRLGNDFVEDHWARTVAPAITVDELARYESFTKVLDQMTPAEPHWYLGLLGARPEHQRRGIARSLLTPMIARAEDEQLPVFLETGMPGNVEVYKRFGFEVIAGDRVPSGPRVWGMLRSAR